VSALAKVEVVPYRPEYRADFERLNRQWIEQLFRIEGADEASLQDPHGTFIADGGEVFFALVDGQALGTCALKREDADTFELCKMAVAPEARGHALGDALMRAALATARERGARSMVLVTNSALGPALGLYRKHGFVTTRSGPEVSRETGYSRADVEMRVAL
jgi:putative acetyltransferase